MDEALSALGADVTVTPVLPPRMTPPLAITRPDEWRVVGVRRHGETVELLAAPRTMAAAV